MKNNLLAFSLLFFLLGPKVFTQQNIWEPVGEPLEGNSFTVLAIDNDNILYAGTYFDFFKSTNNGDVWTSIYNGYYVKSIVFNSQGEMFIGTAGGGGIFKSIDKGETWIHLDDSLINFSINALDIDSNGYLFAAIGGRGMYRSTDNGVSWKEMNNGLTYRSLHKLYIPKNGPLQDYLFVSVNELGLYSYIFRSSNSGSTWEQMNISNGSVWTYAFISTSDGKIYAGLWDTSPHSHYGGVIKSENFGYDWIYAGSNAITTALILDSNDFIYAGPVIIRTTNGGINWESFNSGLPQGCCGSVLACNSEGILFAGSETGIYRTIESTTSVNVNWEVLPNEFNLLQNYPNPFNPRTIIRYELPEQSFVTIKVYDVLGNEVVVLVNDEKVVGAYEVEFDGKNLTSGIYFYQFISRDFVQTKKMVLLK